MIHISANSEIYRQIESVISKLAADFGIDDVHEIGILFDTADGIVSYKVAALDLSDEGIKSILERIQFIKNTPDHTDKDLKEIRDLIAREQNRLSVERLNADVTGRNQIDKKLRILNALRIETFESPYDAEEHSRKLRGLDKPIDPSLLQPKKKAPKPKAPEGGGAESQQEPAQTKNSPSPWGWDVGGLWVSGPEEADAARKSPDYSRHVEIPEEELMQYEVIKIPEGRKTFRREKSSMDTSNIVALNSNTLLIKSGCDEYTKIESALKKIAAENNITDVKAVYVRVTPQESQVDFLCDK